MGGAWGGSPWATYGIPLSRLRSLAKEIGRDHDLAAELWKAPNIDLRCLACMVDEARQVTEAQLERQVKELDHWVLSRAWCRELVARTPHMEVYGTAWLDEQDPVRRRCGWLLLGEMAKAGKDTRDDGWYKEHIATIRERIGDEEGLVRDAMNEALLHIGERSKGLLRDALAAAKAIGPVQVEYGMPRHRPVDVCAKLEARREKLRQRAAA